MTKLLKNNYISCQKVLAIIAPIVYIIYNKVYQQRVHHVYEHPLPISTRNKELSRMKKKGFRMPSAMVILLFTIASQFVDMIREMFYEVIYRID